MDFSTLWTETFSTLEKVIIALAIGVIVAGAMLIYNRRVTGKIVRRLIAEDALTPGTAKTLAELGLRRGAASALRDPDGGMRRCVRVILADGTEAEGRLKSADLADARFYVPEEEKYAAEVRYEAKNTAWPVLIVAIIAAAVVAYLCIKYIPQLLELKLFE